MEPTTAPGWRGWRDRLLLNEDLNFLLTNRIPRVALTHLVGRISRIESPGLTRLLIGIWRLFTDLDLSEARVVHYRSLQACFTRALKPGARPIDPRPDTLVSPCDGIVGACGPIEGTQVFQAKGFPYTLDDLFGDTRHVELFRGGTYVTLRLTSSMYHRFHAPTDLTVEHVSYLSGDTWNVNPIALKRVERLFCKNERALVLARLAGSGAPIALVPVAAVLVASLRLHALNRTLSLRHRGPTAWSCRVPYRRGEEMGWFEQGSTILVFVPPGVLLADGIAEGHRIRMGEALLREGQGAQAQSSRPHSLTTENSG